MFSMPGGEQLFCRQSQGTEWKIPSSKQLLLIMANVSEELAVCPIAVGILQASCQCGVMVQNSGLRSQTVRIGILALTFTSLGKLHNSCVPQFPHL